MIWELRHEFKIWLLIDIANIPRSTYYYYSKQFNSPKPDKYADIKTEIRHIYDENKGRYGYRRITQELKKKFVINHKTVQKLMRKMGIFCRVRMHKYNSYKGDVERIAPNLLERDFKADKPNQKWVTDVTEFALFGIKLYLSPIIDLYNGEVISYNLSRHPNLAQTTDMLEKAFAKISDNTNLILHSDQGWQYQHKRYQKMLADKGIRQSMSRKGNCYDNAAMESFFALLQRNVLDRRRWATRAELRLAIVSWIERTYHRRRRQRALGRLTPIEFELLHTPVATAA